MGLLCGSLAGMFFPAWALGHRLGDSYRLLVSTMEAEELRQGEHGSVLGGDEQMGSNPHILA